MEEDEAREIFRRHYEWQVAMIKKNKSFEDIMNRAVKFYDSCEYKEARKVLEASLG